MKLLNNLELNSLNDLFLNQLQDLYDAEHRLTKALPKMAEAATTPDLKSAFQSHLRETEEHVNRLTRAFQRLGVDPKRETCEAMKGLIEEGEQAISAKGDSEVKDAALIAAAQRVEHYEMSGYGTARSLANRLGHSEIAGILTQTLQEEVAADKKLTKIAETEVNAQALSR